MMTLEIRKARHRDLPAVLQLLAEAENHTPLSAPDAIPIYRKMWRYRDYCWYLALHGTQLVGTFSLLIFPTLLHRGASEAVIHAVIVPAQRGRGIGRMMISKAIRICAEAGCCKLMIGATLGEEPHEVYRSLGLEQSGTHSEIETRHRTKSVTLTIPRAVRVSP